MESKDLQWLHTSDNSLGTNHYLDNDACSRSSTSTGMPSSFFRFGSLLITCMCRMQEKVQE